MKENDILLSVCMITYKHDQFIKYAIDGVLMQKVNFDIELLIADDNSPDNTEQIVLEFITSHPNGKCIKYVKHNENKGMMPNFIWALQQCKGKYIALCEGDDYWTDSYKLQKQVDFLNQNSDIILCYHPVLILKNDGSIVEDFITATPKNYDNIESLARYGNCIHTPSVVFRNILVNLPEEIYLSPMGDYFIYMLLAQKGKIKKLNENMSVYRHGAGVWSSKSEDKNRFDANYCYLLLAHYFSNNNNELISDIFINRISWFLIDNFMKLNEEDFSKLLSYNVLNVKILKKILSILNDFKNEKIYLNKKNIDNYSNINLLRTILKKSFKVCRS